MSKRNSESNNEHEHKKKRKQTEEAKFIDFRAIMSANSQINTEPNKVKAVVNSSSVETNESSSNNNIPGTSKDIIHGNETMLKDNRYEFNYWGKTETTKVLKITESMQHLKINQLIKEKYDQYFLRIRITYKSEIKDTKVGKVASLLVMDETGEIALVGFGKLAFMLYNKFEVDKLYSICNFNVQEENKNYPSGSNHLLQIKANADFICESIDTDIVIPPIDFTFKSITEIKSLKQRTRVDLIGILINDYGLSTTSNSNPIRDLLITDREKESIIVTMWGVEAENFQSIAKSVIVIRKGMTGEFQEKKKLNCTAGTLVWTNPNIPDALSLADWFYEQDKLK